jgi:hypothetical protein
MTTVKGFLWLLAQVVVATVLLAVTTLTLGPVLLAQDDVDLSDNETCMECHADTERGPPKNPERPQVHQPDGSFFVEDHDMWSCNDCHDYITEIPHPDEVLGSEVDCTNCHDEAPTK